MANKETVFSENTQKTQLTVARTFDAPLDLVWKAWTNREMLDQWWAPKPYRVHTKNMDFREGGSCTDKYGINWMLHFQSI